MSIEIREIWNNDGQKKPEERRRYVDMWALPGMHASNVEFLQKLKTADTNHFTTHMDRTFRIPRCSPLVSTTTSGCGI